jgi:hypothetical protein
MQSVAAVARHRQEGLLEPFLEPSMRVASWAALETGWAAVGIAVGQGARYNAFACVRMGGRARSQRDGQVTPREARTLCAFAAPRARGGRSRARRGAEATCPSFLT